MKLAAILVCTAIWSGGLSAAQKEVILVEVDAREAARGLERAHLSIPVQAGPLTLLYPKWLPGDHSPSGPIASVSGLKFSASGRALAWSRDPLDMYAIRVNIPPGTHSLDVDLEVAAVDAPSGLSALQVATPELAIILWNRLVLYPKGRCAADIPFRASLILPEQWNFATALHPVRANAARVEFATEPLDTLIDSTVLIGRIMRTIELGGQSPVWLHMAADSAGALDMKPEMIAHYRVMVSEARALLGAPHYRSYHFLWTLSNHVVPDGIEHHESSDDRSPEGSVVDEGLRGAGASLLPHEYVHSWNGKYRRPVGLAPADFNTPYRTELLWVYEGLTEYLQEVLAVRAGLLSSEEFHEDFAVHAAQMDTHRGRGWRSLQDVATSAQFEYEQSKDWTARTRDTDFYEESALLWLEADVLIRKLSGGHRSLDDFCRAFLAGVGAMKVYGEDDVYAALKAVQPYDWKRFWRERLDRLRPGAPLEGLQASGWRLVFNDVPSSMQKSYDIRDRRFDLRYSLGFVLSDEGAVIRDIVPGSPADVAGIAPGSVLAAIGGRKWSKDALHEVMRKALPEGVSLLVEKDDFFRLAQLNYSDGERYPHLQRQADSADVLADIARPRAPGR